MFRSEDSGILIGLVTIPFEKKGLQFYDEEFKNGIFLNYKNSLREYSSDKEEVNQRNTDFESYYYNPKPYYIFGDYDIAILSLVDDFTLGNRIFHPNTFNNQNGDRTETNYNYNYQVFSGLVPNTQFKSGDNLLEKSKRLIFSENRFDLPYIGLTRIKLNSGLLIGVGYPLISLICKFLLKKRPTEAKSKQKKLDFIIMESFCTNEITLLTFGKTLNDIVQFIIELREKNLKDLRDSLQNVNDSTISKCLEDIKKNSFISKEILTQSDDYNAEDIWNNHIITNTNTILGYDYELALKSQLIIEKGIELPDPSIFELDLGVKPGHLQSISNAINFKKTKVNFGEGGIRINFKDFEKNSLPSILKILNGDKSSHTKSDKSSLIDNLSKIRTFVNISYPGGKTLNECNKHILFSKYLREYSFKNKEIDQIRNQLNICGISKVLRDRTLKMFNNYNDCIEDTILFPYFIELSGFLRKVNDDISGFDSRLKNSQLSIEEVHKIIGSQVEIFEEAYKNRFQQSHRTINLTDNNLEYNGGLQQLISIYDSAFKAITSHLGEHNTKQSFAYVSGYEGVNSKRYAVKLNYFHIFQPEIFISICVKEAANFYLNRIESCENHGDTTGSKNVFFRYLQEDNCDDFIDLKIEIYNKCDGLRNKDIKSKLIEFISPSLFNYLFEDLVTYYYAYNKNTELFSYWYWHYLLQMPHFYTPTREVDNDYFVSFLLRFLIIVYQEDKDYLDQHLLIPPIKEIEHPWRLFFPDTLRFVESLFKLGHLDDWYKLSREITREIVVKEMRSEKETYKTELDQFDCYLQKIKELEEYLLNQRVIHSNSGEKTNDPIKDMEPSELPEEDLDELFESMMRKRVKLVNSVSQEYIKNLGKGQIVEYDSNKCKSEASFITRLFYGYLLTLMKMNENKIGTIKRNATNGLPIKFYQQENQINNPELYGKVLIDPLGGIYINNHTTRKTYFKLRATLLKTLWNFSYKTKPSLFQKL